MQTLPRPTTESINRPGTTPGGADLVSRARARWAGMAGRIGMGFALFGFVMIFFGWNGAASKDYVQGQIPYLISGGVTGLGFIVLGAALLVAESNRRDRAMVERRLEELYHAIGRMGTAAPTNGWAAQPAASTAAARTDLVATGRTSFHRPDCRLVSGRDDAELIGREDAMDAGLTPCRVCKP